jgi:hypothetical protein
VQRQIIRSAWTARAVRVLVRNACQSVDRPSRPPPVLFRDGSLR